MSYYYHCCHHRLLHRDVCESTNIVRSMNLQFGKYLTYLAFIECKERIVFSSLGHERSTGKINHF
jgi:hypothetical protein